MKKLKCFINFIEKKISTQNPLVGFYSDLIDKKLNNLDLSSINKDHEKYNPFWKSRLDVLMSDTYDML